MSDPLNDALREATLAVLLGSTTVPTQYADHNGVNTQGTITIESAFVMHFRSKVMKGEFDDLIRQALDQVSPILIARHFEEMFAKLIMDGLSRSTTSYNSQPNWMQSQARGIAVEACKAALADDDDLKDKLRAMIGAEVDRNKVGITVSLSDPE